LTTTPIYVLMSYMNKTRHGMSYTKTYKTWESMKSRCNGHAGEDVNRRYHDRGITYAIKWETFMGFLEDMGERPPKMQLDRIDNKKGYYKDNCRWITASHNMANTIHKNKTGLPRGVTKHYYKYKARIYTKNKYIFIGSFKTIEEAEKAYIKEYKKLYGELPPEYRS